jgi:hypothetical protein
MSFRVAASGVLSLALTMSPVLADDTLSHVKTLEKAGVDISHIEPTQSTCLVSLLQRIVSDAGAIGTQKLYAGSVVARENSPNHMRVYWPAQRAILIVDLAETSPPCAAAYADPAHERMAMSWYRTKARIDLDTDVVPTKEDVGGSTYLVDQSWVDAVIADCLKSTPLIIEPLLRVESR